MHTNTEAPDSNEFLTTEQLAQLTQTTPSYWEKLRVTGGRDALPFTRIGRNVRYNREDVRRWLAARRRSNTSEGGVE